MSPPATPNNIVAANGIFSSFVTVLTVSKKKLNKKEFFAFYLIELTESEHLSKFSRQYELQSEDNGPKVCVCVYVRCFE